MRILRTALAIVLIASLAALVAGCGGDSKESKPAKNQDKKEMAAADEQPAEVASDAEEASAERAMFNVRIAHSTMIGCFAAKKPKCEVADLVAMNPQLAEPVKLGDKPGGVVIRTNSASGPIGRENFSITATTIPVKADAGTSPLLFQALWTGEDDVFTCSFAYADLCFPAGDSGYPEWPADA